MNSTEQLILLKKQLNQISALVENDHDNSVDLISTMQLSTLINALPYLPYTSSSLRYSSLAYFLNDIVINNRKVIVEFGSGISTIFLSKLIHQLNLTDVKVLSIDNNKDWLEIIHNYISKDHTSLDSIKLIYAESNFCSLSLENNSWYDVEKLGLMEKYKGQIDCVLVDGPEAWHKDIELSRYPALPYMYDFLANGCSIFLDDTNRLGEKSIIEMWSKEYEFKTEQLNSSFTRLSRGVSFNIS